MGESVFYASWKKFHVQSIRIRVSCAVGIDLEAEFRGTNEFLAHRGIDPLPARMLNELKAELPAIIADIQARQKPYRRADYSEILRLPCNRLST
jgi:hypothetical protein